MRLESLSDIAGVPVALMVTTRVTASPTWEAIGRLLHRLLDGRQFAATDGSRSSAAAET
jgi:hypothetical protein